MSKLSHDELLRLARLGAEARLVQIQREMKSLLKAFPALVAPAPRAPRPAEVPAKAKRKRGRKAVSAAERKAISKRMKAYWANKKAAEAKA